MTAESKNRHRDGSGVHVRRGRRARAAAVIAIAGLLSHWGSGLAQEGHPLKGSWLGTWESNETHGENVLMVLDWDGEKITGIINPGTDNIAIADATLDPDGWVLHLEADAAAGSDGAAKVHYVIEGRLENIELPNRSIVGTWSNEQGEGVFDVSRQ